MQSQPIGVCTLVLNDKGQVLLGKRLNSYKAGEYDLPGGRLDLTESLEACAARELFEETSLKSNKMTYIGTVRELQSSYNFIHFAFLCTDFEGNPQTTEPDKCEGWDWYEINNLPQPLLLGHNAVIDMYINNNTPRVRDLLEGV